VKAGEFRLCLIVTAALTVILLSLPLSAAHAVMTKATMPQLTAGATAIARGHVVDVVSQWNDERTTIYTYTSIVVGDWLKGAGPKAITIRTPGGEVGDIGLWVEDVPVFFKGQEVVTFVKPIDEQPFMQVHGLYQGKFTVENGKVIEAGLPVADFVNMVKSVVRAQEKKLNQK
jgi:hypothetical protein